MKITMDISDSCQKDVREFRNLTTICYEVHPIGGEIEETHHVVIVHKDLMLIFSLLLSWISLKQYLDVKANKLENLKKNYLYYQNCKENPVLWLL